MRSLPAMDHDIQAVAHQGLLNVLEERFKLRQAAAPLPRCGTEHSAHGEDDVDWGVGLVCPHWALHVGRAVDDQGDVLISEALQVVCKCNASLENATVAIRDDAVHCDGVVVLAELIVDVVLRHGCWSGKSRWSGRQDRWRKSCWSGRQEGGGTRLKWLWLWIRVRLVVISVRLVVISGRFVVDKWSISGREVVEWSISGL